MDAPLPELGALQLAAAPMFVGPPGPAAFDEDRAPYPDPDDPTEPPCPNSQAAGQHCLCSWIHDCCHWCGKEWGED